jgi:quercetin dioxygenase-like cupin family protein
MNNEMKDYLIDLFLTLPPVDLLSVRQAFKKRPTSTPDEIEKLLESGRTVNTGATNIKFAEEVAAGGIGVRAIHLPYAGDGFENHTHDYDHLTYLAKGSVIAYAPDQMVEKIFHAPRMIMTKAHVPHQFVANEDDTHLMCLHTVEQLDKLGIPFTVLEPVNLIGEDNAE